MQQGSANQNSVVDLTAYRSAKGTQNNYKASSDSDAVRAIEEIALHLLAAVRAIKDFHKRH